MTLHVEPDLSNDAVLSNWLHLYRSDQRAMLVALEPIELAQFDALTPTEQEALVDAVSFAMDTLVDVPELVMRIDGPFFLVGFSVYNTRHATRSTRSTIRASTSAAKKVTSRPIRPALAVQFPTRVTSLQEVTNRAVDDLVDMRRAVRGDIIAN